MKHDKSAQARAERMTRTGDNAKDRGDLARARGSYEAALRLVPELPGAMSGLAAVEGREGNYSAAEALLKAVISSSAPSDRRARATLALADGLYSLGRWEEAFNHYESVVSIDIVESYPGERNWLLADAYVGMGAVEGTRDNVTAAMEFYTKALQQAPNHAPAIASLAACYEEMGRLRDAIFGMTKALQLDPEPGDWWFILGDMYRDAGKPNLARGNYQKAIEKGEQGAVRALAELPPETPAQWYDTGKEYELAGKAEWAAWSYRRALMLGDKRAEAELRRLEDEKRS